MNDLPKLSKEETLENHINQNNIFPGTERLEQFQKALALRGTPPIYSQENQKDPEACVKFFDPCGAYTWYATEWDGKSNCFGYVSGHENELGYFNIKELSDFRGPLGIGIEVDVWFKPQPLSEVQRVHEVAQVADEIQPSPLTFKEHGLEPGD